MWDPPTATDVAPVRLKTATGVLDVVQLPSPSWPSALLPQHTTVVSALVAHVWKPPAASEVTLVSPVTFTGVEEDVKDPLPSWPKLLLPQHRTVPLARSTQLCWRPDTMAVTAELPPGTDVGGVVVVTPGSVVGGVHAAATPSVTAASATAIVVLTLRKDTSWKDTSLPPVLGRSGPDLRPGRRW